MRYCNTCNNNYTNCCCSSTVVSSTTINSDQAGRDGLDAKDILIRLGKLPTNASDNQFYEEIKGDKGDQGESGYTPYVGVNDNWWTNGIDTGKPSKTSAATGVEEFGDNA